MLNELENFITFIQTEYIQFIERDYIEGRRLMKYHLQHCTNPYAKSMIQQFFRKNPKAVSESITISNGLLQCSTSRIEEWYEMIITALVALRMKDKSKAMGILTDALSLPKQPGEDENTQKFQDTICKCTGFLVLPHSDMQTLVTMLHSLLKSFKQYLNEIRETKMYFVAIASILPACVCIVIQYLSFFHKNIVQHFIPPCGLRQAKKVSVKNKKFMLDNWGKGAYDNPII